MGTSHGVSKLAMQPVPGDSQQSAPAKQPQQAITIGSFHQVFQNLALNLDVGGCSIGRHRRAALGLGIHKTAPGL